VVSRLWAAPAPPLQQLLILDQLHIASTAIHQINLQGHACVLFISGPWDVGSDFGLHGQLD